MADWFDDFTDFISSPGGSALIGAGTSLATGLLGSEAQRSASAGAVGAVREAGQLASQTQQEMFEKSLALGAPYRELGAAQLPLYAAAVMGQDVGRQKLGDMAFGGELYDIQQEDLQDSINKQLAARGRLDSGAGLKAQYEAQTRLGAQEADKAFGRALTVSNLDYGRLLDSINIGSGQAGQGAGLAQAQGAGLANTYMGTAGQAAPLMQDVGTARASAYGGINQAVQGGLSNYYTAQLMG